MPAISVCGLSVENQDVNCIACICAYGLILLRRMLNAIVIGRRLPAHFRAAHTEDKP